MKQNVKIYAVKDDKLILIKKSNVKTLFKKYLRLKHEGKMD